MLKRELLHSDTIDGLQTRLASCYNARGQYVPMHLVIRLRPDIHAALEGVENDMKFKDELDADVVQAMSTYFHETIHWWQHIGSTSGFCLTLSHPSQTHINVALLEEFVGITGKVKPITKYNNLNKKEFIPSTREFQVINELLNNFYDLEFYKNLAFKPAWTNEIYHHTFFESWGHTNIVTYSTLWAVIASPFGEELSVAPDIKVWNEKYKLLNSGLVQDFYHESPLVVTNLGVLQLYEGQARFSQMQYLYLASGGTLSWYDFESMGMLDGEYYEAFQVFLDALMVPRPDNVTSSLVGLFLLVIDIAINPSQGFPYDIDNLEQFPRAVNPGFRFHRLCQAINELHPEFKSIDIDYGYDTYLKISSALARAIGSNTPAEISAEIVSWIDRDVDIASLMEEERTFEFGSENMPIRLLLATFINMQKDKLISPEFFCWPGIYLAGKKSSMQYLELFDKHQSLFSDKADGDIYPRLISGKSEANIQETFKQFYTWMSHYQLCRQWISEDGEFDYDFLWLTSKASREEIKDWVDRHFKRVWGFGPDDFTVL